MTTATLIELVLDVAASGIWPSEDACTKQAEAYVEEIKTRYSHYKQHHDFQTAARLARTEVIEMMMQNTGAKPNE